LGKTDKLPIGGIGIGSGYRDQDVDVVNAALMKNRRSRILTQDRGMPKIFRQAIDFNAAW
jgi:hypothetical protein